MIYPLSILMGKNEMAVIVGEVANFAAYAFAPAVLVTPLGALSIIVRYGLMYLMKLPFLWITMGREKSRAI